MKKYLCIITNTFNDSLQHVANIIFRFIGYIVLMAVLLSLWSFIYQDGTNLINGYTLEQMIWYILLGELITFGSGSRVAVDDIQNDIKSGNIAYQINKPYSYPLYIICKYYADTFIRFLLYTVVSIVLGIIFVGPIKGFNIQTLLFVIPIFLLAVLTTGLIRILISFCSFWVEDSKPFQNIYNKLILMFGVMFPIEMFPNAIQSIIRFTPIYGVSYGPAKLVLSFNFELLRDVLISQIITILLVGLLISILYKKGVKKLNVNGG